MSTSVSQHIIVADYEAVKVILKSGNVNLVHIQASFSNNHWRRASLVNYLLIYTHTQFIVAAADMVKLKFSCIHIGNIFILHTDLLKYFMNIYHFFSFFKALKFKFIKYFLQNQTDFDPSWKSKKLH